MSQGQAQETFHELLMEQLRDDSSGQVRDRWLDELVVAADDIAAALGTHAESSNEAQTLRDLLASVQLSERVLVEVWNALHS